MKPHLLVSALVALADVTTAKDHRTFAVLRFTNKQLTKGRMDPIRSPGRVGAHVHNIMGGSGFGLSSSGHDLTQSNCSTALVKGDNSNYWFPSLYFKDPKTGKYEDVELFYANAYYFFEPTNDDIKAFPLALNMVSGDVDTRTAPASGPSSNIDPSKGPVNPVKWTCPRDGNNYSPPSWPADSDGSLAGIGDPVNKGEGVGFPDVNCDGFGSPLRADIHFPSCYNPDVGLTAYKRNMVFPTESAGGKMDCPKGHIHVPHLFLEVYWNTPAFKSRWEQAKGSQPFVLSNGDPTGFSLHADFMAGWDEKLLQHIIDTCDAGTNGMDKCPGLPYGLNQDHCAIEPAVDEKVDGVLDALPGRNPLAGWAYGEASASASPSGSEVVPTPASSRAGVTGSQTSASSRDEVTGSQTPASSREEVTGSQTPASPSEEVTGSQTPTSSRAEVAGSPTQARGYPSNEAPSGSSTEVRHQSPTEALAGPSTARPYQLPSKGLAKPYTNSSSHGAAPEPTKVQTRLHPTVSSPPYLAPSSAPASAPQPTDSTACVTRTVTVRETITVTKQAPVATGAPYTNSTASVGGYKYAGCFRDASERALGGIIRADLGAVTNAKCVAHCKAAGYALAGTEYGGQCYCGNELVGSRRLGEGKCDMACEGDGSAVCGGGWALSVYSRDGRADIKATRSRRQLHHHVRRHRSPHH